MAQPDRASRPNPRSPGVQPDFFLEVSFKKISSTAPFWDLSFQSLSTGWKSCQNLGSFILQVIDQCLRQSARDPHWGLKSGEPVPLPERKPDFERWPREPRDGTTRPGLRLRLQRPRRRRRVSKALNSLDCNSRAN